MRGRRFHPFFSIVAVSVSLAAAAACSSFSSTPTGTVPGAGAADAQPSSDAAGDAPAPPPPGDAAPEGAPIEAGADAEAAFCSGTHFVCDTFERTTPVDPAIWTSDVGAGGNLAIDQGALASSAPTTGRARLLHSAIGTGRTLHCTMNLELHAVGDVETTVATVKVDDLSKGNFLVELRARVDRTFSIAYSGSKPDGTPIGASEPIVASAALPLATWTTVELTVAVGDTPQARGAVGGNVGEADAAPAATMPTFARAEASVGVFGLSSSPTAAPWEVEYDDLVCDVLP